MGLPWEDAAAAQRKQAGDLDQQAAQRQKDKIVADNNKNAQQSANVFGSSFEDFPEYGSTDNFKVPGAQLPTTDPRYQAILNKQKDVAQNFRNDLPKYQTELGNQYATQSKKNLASNLKDVKKQYNSRGLLNSGLRQAAEAGKVYSSDYNTSQAQLGINTTLNQQADSLDQDVVNNAYGMAGYAPQLGSGLLSQQQNNINDYISGQQALGDAGGGLGKGLGYIFSTLNKKEN